MKDRLKFSASILVSALVLFFVTADATGQSSRPTPVNVDEAPRVVSRDQTPARKAIPIQSSVRELPAELAGPVRTPVSPYQIKISKAQQQMMLYLDLLTKTEARAEMLRSSLFEMIEKENEMQAKIGRIEYGLRPDQIQNSAALSGSLRPENIRDYRRKVLTSEKTSIESLLRQIRSNRLRLEGSIVQADRLVSRVRFKFERFVDAALEEGNEY